MKRERLFMKKSEDLSPELLDEFPPAISNKMILSHPQLEDEYYRIDRVCWNCTAKNWVYVRKGYISSLGASPPLQKITLICHHCGCDTIDVYVKKNTD